MHVDIAQTHIERTSQHCTTSLGSVDMAQWWQCMRSRTSREHAGAGMHGCPASVHARKETQTPEQTPQQCRDCGKNICSLRAQTLTAADAAELAPKPGPARRDAPHIRTTTHCQPIRAHAAEAPRPTPVSQRQHAYGSRNASQHPSSAQHLEHCRCRWVSPTSCPLATTTPRPESREPGGWIRGRQSKRAIETWAAQRCTGTEVSLDQTSPRRTTRVHACRIGRGSSRALSTCTALAKAMWLGSPAAGHPFNSGLDLQRSGSRKHRGT